MSGRASWWLKLDRAEEHAIHFKDELRRYLESHPYSAVRCGPATPPCKQHTDCWRYCLRITRQPDPRLSLIAGDALHNLRSVLDHLAVAMVPSRRRNIASFPIETDDLWARRGSRYLIREPERRRRFTSAVAGMSTQAVSEIKALQPYQNGRIAKRSTLYLLNRLDNADKHRRLVLLAVGLNNVVSTVIVRGQQLSLPMPDWPDGTASFVNEGAVVAHFGHRGSWTLTATNLWYPAGTVQESEVSVSVTGIPSIAIAIIDEQRKENAPPQFMPFDILLEAILWDCRNNWIPTLEPHVRARKPPQRP